MKFRNAKAEQLTKEHQVCIYSELENNICVCSVRNKERKAFLQLILGETALDKYFLGLGLYYNSVLAVNLQIDNTIIPPEEFTYKASTIQRLLFCSVPVLQGLSWRPNFLWIQAGIDCETLFSAQRCSVLHLGCFIWGFSNPCNKGTPFISCAAVQYLIFLPYLYESVSLI